VVSALPQEMRDRFESLLWLQGFRTSSKRRETAWTGSLSRAGHPPPSAGTSVSPQLGIRGAEDWEGEGEGARDHGIPFLAEEGERVAALKHFMTLLLRSELNALVSHR